jgi:hypothetical protein
VGSLRWDSGGDGDDDDDDDGDGDDAEEDLFVCKVQCEKKNVLSPGGMTVSGKSERVT